MCANKIEFVQNTKFDLLWPKCTTFICDKYFFLPSGNCVHTIRWLITAVRALWSPLRQWRLRARHSNNAWLHICNSWGPNVSSGKHNLNWIIKKKSMYCSYKYNISHKYSTDELFKLLFDTKWGNSELKLSLPLQRRMCVAMRVSCCLKKVMLVWVISTPSNTLTEDSLCWVSKEKISSEVFQSKADGTLT